MEYGIIQLDHLICKLYRLSNCRQDLDVSSFQQSVLIKKWFPRIFELSAFKRPSYRLLLTQLPSSHSCQCFFQDFFLRDFNGQCNVLILISNIINVITSTSRARFVLLSWFLIIFLCLINPNNIDLCLWSGKILNESSCETMLFFVLLCKYTVKIV